MVTKHVSVESVTVPVLETSAVVHRACRQCGAPGTWQARTSARRQPADARKIEEWRFQNWPKIFIPAGDERAGRPVGAVCPCCGASRKGLSENRGVIHERIYFPSLKWIALSLSHLFTALFTAHISWSKPK